MCMWEGLAYISMTYNNLIVFFKQQQVILHVKALPADHQHLILVSIIWHNYCYMYYI